MTKIAIIAGISGQDGFYLSKKLLKKKYKIIGLSRKKINQKKIKIIKTRYSYKELVKIIKKYKPNVIYNLAGESNPRISWKKINETQKSIINLTINFLEAIRKYSIKTKYFNSSTSEIYGTKKKKINEKDKFNPTNPYGCFKTTSHLLVKIYRDTHKIFAVNGVLFNHDSIKRPKGFLIREILDYCISKNKNNFKLVLQEPHAIRDYAHAEDIVEGIYKIMNLKNPDDYIICGGTVRNVKEITYQFFNRFRINKNKLVFLNNKKTNRINKKIGNNNKLKRITRWYPKYKENKLIEKLAREV